MKIRDKLKLVLFEQSFQAKKRYGIRYGQAGLINIRSFAKVIADPDCPVSPRMIPFAERLHLQFTTDHQSANNLLGTLTLACILSKLKLNQIKKVKHFMDSKKEHKKQND